MQFRNVYLEMYCSSYHVLCHLRIIIIIIIIIRQSWTEIEREKLKISSMNAKKKKISSKHIRHVFR